MKQRIRINENQLKQIVKGAVKKVLKENYVSQEATFCHSGDEKYDYLSNEIFDYIEDWGISLQMQDNKTFQEGRKLLHKALKTLENGFREYNNYEDGGAYEGGEGFTDYSGGSLY